jgi:hypothetical protein
MLLAAEAAAPRTALAAIDAYRPAAMLLAAEAATPRTALAAIDAHRSSAMLAAAAAAAAATVLLRLRWHGRGKQRGYQRAESAGLHQLILRHGAFSVSIRPLHPRRLSMRWL